MKKLFVNVDVDALRFYYNLYGERKNIKDNIIWERAIPRFLKLFKKINIKANFFIVGSDLLNNKNVTIAKKIIKEGHKINSHSYYHNYDLTKKNYKNIYIDIKKNQQIFYKLFKIKNLVFRSPGYKINYKVYKSMKNNKLRFSSSILPSFFYSLIKNVNDFLYFRTIRFHISVNSN
jgi:peptidoglycan/xylan/chitin deacetylase (PgdA/CDA1 family)